MEALLNILKGAAPALATAVAGPLGGAAISAIANKATSTSTSVKPRDRVDAGDVIRAPARW